MKNILLVLAFVTGCADSVESASRTTATPPSESASEAIPAGYGFSFQLEGYPERFLGHFMFGVVNDDVVVSITGSSGSAERARRVTGHLVLEREGTRLQRAAGGGLHAALAYRPDEPDQNLRGVGTFTISTVEGGARTVRGVSVMRYEIDIDPHGTVALSATVRDHSFRGGEDPTGPDLQLTGAGRGSFGCSIQPFQHASA